MKTKQCLELEQHAAQLRETLKQREFELSSRPTHRSLQLLRNQVAQLERDAHPEREALRRLTDTRELVRRDKQRHSTGSLAVVSACIGGRGIGSTLAGHSTANHPAGTPANGFQEPNCLMRSCLARELRQRSALAGASFTSEVSDKELLRQVAELVAFERQALAEARKAGAVKAMFSRAEAEMAQDPLEASHQILKHFMRLFRVHSLDGCLPAISALFAQLGELKSLHNAACEFLQLDPVKVSAGEAAVAFGRGSTVMSQY